MTKGENSERKKPSGAATARMRDGERDVTGALRSWVVGTRRLNEAAELIDLQLKKRKRRAAPNGYELVLRWGREAYYGENYRESSK